MRVRRDPRGWPGRVVLILFAFVVLSVAVALGDRAPLGFAFKDYAAAAGLTAVSVFEDKDADRYRLESTGSGGGGGSGGGREERRSQDNNEADEFLFATSSIKHRLYRNRGDGTFEDVTARAGLVNQELGATSVAASAGGFQGGSRAPALRS